MNTEQHEMYENARKRIKQKKVLYFHFIFLLVGSLFMYIINKWLHVGEPNNWYLWAITSWSFLFVLHLIKVFIADRFLNKDWERAQINKLITMQEEKIEELKKDIQNKNSN